MRSAVLALTLGLAACSGPADGDAPPGGSGDGSATAPSVDPHPTAAPSPAARAGDTGVRLARVATLEQPLALATRAGDRGIYVAQKTGQVVRLIEGRSPVVLNIASRISQGGEQGLLGIEFSPDGDLLYVNFTDIEGDTVIEEYEMGRRAPRAASRREVLALDQPYSNHNGGHLAFGPDGYLYIGLGDGGSGGDPENRAQDPSTLLGKMLRIDPLGGDPYGVPDDNPFVGDPGTLPEIWALGLRNPWRYSFDRENGDLWIGDVGQSSREEIDRQPGSSDGGENYGWDRLEGTEPHEGEPPPGAVPPIHEYGRDDGATVIGGYVYRGSRIPSLRGAYLFGDFYNADIKALRRRAGGVRIRALGLEVENLGSFGEGTTGELYALSLSGPVYRIAPGRG